MRKIIKDFINVITIPIIVLVIAVFAYCYNFKDGIISKQSDDWANFSTYINGLITPFLTIITIFVMLKVNYSIKNSSFNHNDLLKKLTKKYRKMDFTMEIPKDKSFEHSIKELNELVINLKYNIDSILTDQEELKKDIISKCEKQGYDVSMIQEAFQNYNSFESKCLEYPNILSHIKMYLILTEIGHYKELDKKDNNISYEGKLKDLYVQLDKTIENNTLAD